MSDTELFAIGTGHSEPTPAATVPTVSPRFHGLDGVRATAMLLGVFYHLPIAVMAGGIGMGFGFDFGGSPKTPIDNWLHSFRMPLFFLISGFFANMVLGKYGLKRYWLRRWWRIGAPLFIALFAFAGYRVTADCFRAQNPAPFGPPGAMNFGFAPGAGPFGPQAPGALAASREGDAALPTTANGPGGGFAGPPPATFGGAFGPPGGFGGNGPFGGPPGGFGGPGPGAFGPSGGPTTAPVLVMPPPPSRTWADRLFGQYSQHFNLEHLWFFWYLLVFVTVAPLVVKVFSWIFLRPQFRAVDELGRVLIRYNVVALPLGLATLPALLHARGFVGWSLANPIGFLAPFPDFLLQYYADVPYYFLYFMGGWWLYRLRDGLPDLARSWLWSLVLGIAGFAASQRLSNAYAMQPGAASPEWIRLVAFALYGSGAAYTTCAFIGFFQRYLDRPTRLGRYFTDMALWIYLVHLPLIPHLIWWIQPTRSSWLGASLTGMLLVTGVALILYELIVRPTPLVHVFGPPQPRQVLPPRAPAVEGLAPG